MKLIKQIYDLVNLATDKGITGYHSDSQIMDAIHEGQMVLWRQLIKQFPKDKRVRNDLLSFEMAAELTLVGGADTRGGPLPDDFEHEIEAWLIDATDASNPIRRPITFVEHGFFLRRLHDPVDPPTLVAPIARFVGFDGEKFIEVGPLVSNVCGLRYFRKPVKPVFSTIESGGTYIYNDDTSTDVEWSETLYDILIRNSLARLGLNMRDGQVQAAGVVPEVKEATL